MTLNTFGDIINLTKQRCNISSVNEFDDIIATAVNNAYVELKRKDSDIKTCTVISADGLAILPQDLDSIISIVPGLYADEYRKGRHLILQRNEPITFTILYEAVPLPLNTTDVPDINKKYWYALSTYGCHAYYQFKKKDQVSQSYLQSYYSQVESAEPDDQVQNQIQNVYDIFLR